jgi:lipopolysaccharide transport system ATP-binding protein
MDEIAIRVEALGKEYHIGRLLSRQETFRDILARTFINPYRRCVKLLRGQASAAAELDETIWAIKDISFEIKRGEAVGIIGCNGAGKSTLLKILSRITEPTAGFAVVYGRVGSLLEVGTGFHQELTGRENIYLNGAILGMGKADIDRNFDEIVAFAEVQKFIDTPVKHYSSGMYLRLAFAVAAHMEPEILLVDEVLAVGDAAFQKKCLGKMDKIAKEGRTVLFVSHNMGAITHLCQKALWLDDGQLRLTGSSGDVVSSYLSSGTDGKAIWHNKTVSPTEKEVQLRSVRLLSRDNNPTSVVGFASPFAVEIAYEVLEPIRDLSVTYQLFDSGGTLVLESMDTDMPEWKGRIREPGQYLAVCEVPERLLKPGRYHLSVVSFVERVKIIERQEGVIVFDVSEVGYSLNPGRLGVVSPVFQWKVTRTDVLSTVNANE